MEEKELQTAILVGAYLNDGSDFAHSMEELGSLAQALELEVLTSVIQPMDHPNPATYVGSGKVQEIAELAEEYKADYVIFQDSLSPTQLKNVQKEMEATVMDRTNLILEIFARRARTREARLQVESANLQYLLPRLVGMNAQLGRQGGASGSMSNKGTGEKQLELDRRRIEKRLSQLRRELETMEHDRMIQRERREKSSLPLVALVGYTNAGKSTLMNALLDRYGVFDEESLEDKQVMAKDMLFATLDTTVRRIAPPNRKDFLLSDTVGFIDHLPHGLVKAFRSTLDEVKYADLLLEVVDVSDPNFRDHMRVTQETLDELGVKDTPIVYVLNKADRTEYADQLPRVQEDRIHMAAGAGIGLEELLTKIQSRVYGGNREVEFMVPYAKGAVVSALNEGATVLEQDYREEGIYLKVDCPEILIGRYSEYMKE